MAERKFNYGLGFQIDLITMMIRNIRFLKICQRNVNSEFFTSERLQKFVDKIYKYERKYNRIPDKTFLRSICEDPKDKVILKRIFTERQIGEQYIRDKVEDFVKRSMFIDFYTKAGKEYNKNNVENAYDIMYEGMEQIYKLSLYEDNFEFLISGFLERLAQRDHDNNLQKRFRIKTGIPRLDRALRGGPMGGEVNMLLGDAKSGKSWGLIHMGVNAVRRFNTVLHIQLEGKREEVLDRYDTAFMKIEYDNVVKNEIPKDILRKMREISLSRKKRDLIIRSYSDWDACTIEDIEREFLDLNARGFNIKVVIIDYMDLMKSRKNYSEERHRQQSIIRDIKTFATKHNVVVWTATQANRGDKDRNNPNKLLTAKDLAEDYGKVRAIDTLITINVTDKEAEKKYFRLYLANARSVEQGQIIYGNRDLSRGIFFMPVSKEKNAKQERKELYKKKVKKEKESNNKESKNKKKMVA